MTTTPYPISLHYLATLATEQHENTTWEAIIWVKNASIMAMGGGDTEAEAIQDAEQAVLALFAHHGLWKDYAAMDAADQFYFIGHGLIKENAQGDLVRVWSIGS